jgi:putative ABC transport system substrate-binding protein
MPVIGFLDPRSPDALGERLRGFRQGLKEAGYVGGENVTIVYQWGENQFDRVPDMADDLIRRPVSVIVASGGPAVALRVKAATTFIPVVFLAAEDPVKLGLVSGVARPGGNLTGVNFFSSELVAKRLELLHELVPKAARVAVLVNPTNAQNTETTLRDIAPAARAMGLQILVLNARSSREIDAAFASVVQDRPDALFIGGDSFLDSRRVQLVHLATHHRIPAAYSGREYAEAGGLMSYGSDITDAYRQVGIYTGRILKGAKPADLPVIQANKFEFVINAQTARTLGLAIPLSLLTAADQVIE